MKTVNFLTLFISSFLLRCIQSDVLVDKLTNSIDQAKNVNFDFDDVEKLLQRLSFQNCSGTSNTTKCNLCVTPERVMKWFNYPLNKTLSLSEFQDLSSGVLYLLSEYKTSSSSTGWHAHCKLYMNQLLSINVSNIFEHFLTKYRSDGILLSEYGLVRILDNVNLTIGHELRKEKECFNGHHVLQGTGVPDSGFKYAGLKKISVFILNKLLQKVCFAREKGHTFVMKTDFMQGLTKTYGNNSHMSIQGFYDLHKKIFGTKCDKEKNGHHHDEDHHDNDKCLQANELFSIFHISRRSSITQKQLQEISPAIVKMVNDYGCASQDNNGNKTKIHHHNDGWEPWVASAISITIISFGSLIGILVFRGKQRAAFPYILIFMVALGLSVLLGDALLHLIPHSLGLHNHDHHDHDDAHGHSDPYKSDNPVWKSLLFLGGVYIFIIFELIMKICMKDGSHMHSHSNIEPPLHDSEPKQNGSTLLNGTTNGTTNQKKVVEPEKPQKLKVKSIQSVAWMILLGDGVHNFMDGVAIGAAFSEPFPMGLQGGIMTSIAIMLHEVPHELGDFAVLISTGLSLPQAFCLNLLSSLTAFVGGVVGILLGVNWNASPWIFAFTGGLFVYISLVNMLPEVMNNPLLKSSPKLTLPLVLLGITLGFLIMFFIAVYEHQILTALN